MELQDKVALVTGGGTGLGKAISLALAQEGAHVAVNYSRSEGDARQTVQEVTALGRRAIAVKADVSDAAVVKDMVEKTLAELGRIDILVNNAATTAFVDFKDLEGMTEEAWDRIMAVNIKGPFLCTKAVASLMLGQQSGRIINISSNAGLRPAGSCLAYCASKAALVHLTRCLAISLAPHVLVNAVAPGRMPTRWSPSLSPEALDRVVQAFPLKREAALGDVAAAVVFLAKNDSMTGQVLVTDCGLTM